LINDRHSGQSLVEVVVVTGIVMLVLVALVAGAMMAVRNSQFSRARTRAMQLSREATEWIRSERREGWSEFANHSGTFCLQGLEGLDFTKNSDCSSSEKISNQFTRQAVLVKESNEKVKVTVTTSWEDSNGEHSEEVITYLTKW